MLFKIKWMLWCAGNIYKMIGKFERTDEEKAKEQPNNQVQSHENSLFFVMTIDEKWLNYSQAVLFYRPFLTSGTSFTSNKPNTDHVEMA